MNERCARPILVSAVLVWEVFVGAGPPANAFAQDAAANVASVVRREPPAPEAEPDPPATPSQPVLPRRDPPAPEAEPPLEPQPAPSQPAPSQPAPRRPIAPPTGAFDRGTDPPWAKSLSKPLKVPLEPAHPRELFPNLSASEWDSFFDSQPLDPHYDPLLKMLYQVARNDQGQFERLVQSEITWPQLLAEPHTKRGTAFRVKGRAVHVRRVVLAPRLAELLEYEAYYQVRVKLEDPNFEALICARQIPAAWAKSAAQGTLDHRVMVVGLFLQVLPRGDAPRDEPEPPPSPESPRTIAFAANRVGWYPDREAADLGVTADHVFLSGRGMDVGPLFDVVDGKESLEYEGFYQMLGAFRRCQLAELTGRPKPVLDLPELLKAPAKSRGRLFSVAMRARRITRIELSQPDVRQRFGLTHYYQLDGFVKIGDQQIKLGPGKDAPIFASDFPATMCVLDLPAKLKKRIERSPDDLRQGQEVNEPMRVEAAFYRVWAYPSKFVQEVDPRTLQVSPLFIGLQPELLPHGEAADTTPIANAGTIILFIVLVAVMLSFLRIGKGPFRRPPLPDQLPR